MMPMDSQITPVSALGRVTTDPDIRWKSRKRSRLLDIDISETFVTTEMITEGVQPLTCESRELEFYYTCQHCSFCSYDSSEFKDHLSSRRPGCYFQCDLCTFNSCTTSGIRIHTEKLHSSLPINFEIIPKMQPTQTIMDVNNVSEIEIERSFRRHETIANADVISEESALSPRFEYDGGDESMVGNSAEEESMKTLICESIQVKPVGFSVGCASIEEDAHEKEQETTIRFGKEVQLFRLETEPEEILGSPKESLICMFCNKEFKARLHLEHHYSIHTEEDLFKCELCSYATNCISHLQMHQGSIKGRNGNIFLCTQCDFKSCTSSLFQIHLTEIHPEEEVSHFGEDITATVLEHLNEANSTSQVLMPIETPTNERNLSHEHLDQSEPRLLKATEEISMQHVVTRPETENTRVVCNFCSKKFAGNHKNRRLEEHIRVHTGEKPYKCNECPYTCAQNSVLCRHRRRHHVTSSSSMFPKSNESITNRCNYSSFTSDSSVLLQHQAQDAHSASFISDSHPGDGNIAERDTKMKSEIPYTKCTYCNYRSKYRSATLAHERLHTGEKPCQCHICGKHFSDGSTLRRHKGIHQRNKTIALNEKDLCK